MNFRIFLGVCLIANSISAESQGSHPFGALHLAMKAKTQFRGANTYSGNCYNYKSMIDNTVKDFGTNILRWQIKIGDRYDIWGNEALWINGSKPTFDETDTSNYQKWILDEIRLLDEALVYCKANNQRVIINLWTMPGADIDGKTLLFTPNGTKYQLALQNAWITIANHFSKSENRSVIFAYDIFNEPMPDGESSDPFGDKISIWYSVTNSVITHIRSIDANTPIMIEPYEGAAPSGFNVLEPFPYQNIIYSPHFYQPIALTHHFEDAGKYTYPGNIPWSWKSVDWSSDPNVIANYGYWNSRQLRNEMQYIRDFQLKYNAEIFIGEFSIEKNAIGESGYNYLKDAIELFEQYGWNWCYHIIGEGGDSHWDPYTGSDITLLNSRMNILKSSLKKNYQ